MYFGKAPSQQRPHMPAMKEAKALAHRWAMKQMSTVYIETDGTKQEHGTHTYHNWGPFSKQLW